MNNLDRVYASALAARRYPAALVNRKRWLLQHDNAHTAALIKANIKDLPPGIEFLPHRPACPGPDLAPPSDDYHMFHSMAYFLRGRQDLQFSGSRLGKWVLSRFFFAYKTAEWFRHEIEQLRQMWMN